MEGRGVPRLQNEVFLDAAAERRRHAVDSNYNYKNEDDVNGRSSATNDDFDRNCLRRSGGRKTVALLKGTGGIIIDPRSPSSSGAEERAAAAAAVTGCLRSPGPVVSNAARRSNGKRVTFDGHDAEGVGNDGVIASHDKRGVVVVVTAEVEEKKKEDRLSSTPGVTSVSCTAGCHSDRLTGMPKGSTTTPSVAVNRHDRTKTGCFGCISRKNAKSMAGKRIGLLVD